MVKEFNNNLVREISLYEQIVQSYGNVVSRSRIRGKINLEAFRNALSIISERHSFLNCVFYKKDIKEVFFKRIFDLLLPLTIKYQIIDESKRDILYREELNNILDPYEKLWRILLIVDTKEGNELNKNSRIDLILTVQHAICDGNSLLNLVKEILEQTQAIQNNKKLYEDLKLPIIPPIEDFLDNWIKDQKIGNSNDTNYNNVYKLNIDFSILKKNRSINFLEDALSQTETINLIKRSREHDTTVHGILCACMLKSIQKKLKITFRQSIEVVLNIAVNPRKIISPAPGHDALSCFVYSEQVVCSIDNNITIIQLAQQIIKKLNQQIQDNDAIKIMLKQLKLKEIKKIGTDPSPILLSVSNVGKLNIQADYTDFQLEKTNFTASEHFPRILMSITTFNENLNYTILYTEPWFKTNLIVDINHQFKAYLSDFLK